MVGFLIGDDKEVAEKDKQPARRKRQLRAPSETVREKQQQAQTVEKPRTRWRSFWRFVFTPFRKLAGLSFWQKPFWKPFKKAGHVLGLIFWPPYFRNSFKELKLVTWPNWKQSWRLTGAVLAFAFVFGVFIAIVDYGLDKLFKEILLK